METIIKIFLTSILYVGCIIMMILCISDMLRTRKRGKELEKDLKDLEIELVKQELDIYKLYERRYHNIVEELERQGILVYELDNGKYILTPKERKD